jgi:hypothetical protein
VVVDFFPRSPEDVGETKHPCSQVRPTFLCNRRIALGHFVAILIDSSGTRLLLAATNKSPSKQIKFRRLYFAALCIYSPASFRSALCPGS